MPLYQNKVNCSAFDIEMIFILMQVKLIYTRKVVHLASFWKWGFLELVGGLFPFLDPRRKLGRVNFRKDFWDCYWEQEIK